MVETCNIPGQLGTFYCFGLDSCTSRFILIGLGSCTVVLHGNCRGQNDFLFAKRKNTSRLRHLAKLLCA